MIFVAENDDVGNTLYDEDTNEVDNRSCKRKKDRFVTAREYYCFRLQVRRGLFNIILFGRRLFQQWAVDIYIKIESMPWIGILTLRTKRRYELSCTR